MDCRTLESFLSNPTADYIDTNLFNNNIGPEDAVAIGQALALKSHPTLRRLSLWVNHIGPQGAAAVAQALESNDILQILDLDKNGIGNDGAVAVGRSLETNKTLVELHISSNNIGPDGAVAIGQGLESNNTLQELYISHNGIGDIGAIAIIQSIARNTQNNNTRLTRLDIRSNQITTLPAELAQCTRLTRFDYSSNPIDYIPPNVQRWLDRFQHQQNPEIHQDSQNVHNRQIQQCVKDSMNRIINSCNGPPDYKSFEEVRNVIVNDSILTPQCKTQLIEYASDGTEVHMSLGITFAEALQYVFTRININKNSDEIKRILNQEMSDALCMCFTGRISRLLNCLNVIDVLVRIHIVSLPDMFTDVGKRLIKEGSYNTSTHQTMFERELQEDYGYELTIEFKKELEQKFYSQMEYFYETYAPMIAENLVPDNKHTPNISLLE